ncbi:hypothetical protein [Paenibacillus sp. GCM10027626]|uniref:hypothetical protein n=1 Tax=Paenibacillus sp. GCM10027626 TaxID=3273411 RepID=UPI003626B5B3
MAQLNDGKGEQSVQAIDRLGSGQPGTDKEEQEQQSGQMDDGIAPHWQDLYRSIAKAVREMRY